MAVAAVTTGSGDSATSLEAILEVVKGIHDTRLTACTTRLYM
jgi:hypothetical protein